MLDKLLQCNAENNILRILAVTVQCEMMIVYILLKQILYTTLDGIADTSYCIDFCNVCKISVSLDDKMFHRKKQEKKQNSKYNFSLKKESISRGIYSAGAVVLLITDTLQHPDKCFRNPSTERRLFPDEEHWRQILQSHNA